MPVPGATLTLISRVGRQAGRGRAGADGGYTIPVSRAGRYTLIAIARGYQPQAIAVTADGAASGFDVTLPGDSSLAGTVRAAGTGQPLAGAAVSVASGSGEIIAGQTTDGAGRYQVAGLAPGGYTLAVTAAGHQPAALPVTVAAGEQSVQDAELDGGGGVQGSARTPAGAAVPDALITLLDRDGNVAAATTTGADGSYAIPGVPAGDYTVISTGYPPVASAVTVTAGTPQVHDVRLGHPEGRASAR
jgi:uncharacterized surface anchored protein